MQESYSNVDIEGYQQGSSSPRSESEPPKRSFAFLILPVTVIFCGALLLASRHTTTDTSGIFLVLIFGPYVYPFF